MLPIELHNLQSTCVPFYFNHSSIHNSDGTADMVEHGPHIFLLLARIAGVRVRLCVPSGLRYIQNWDILI